MNLTLLNTNWESSLGILWQYVIHFCIRIIAFTKFLERNTFNKSICLVFMHFQTILFLIYSKYIGIKISSYFLSAESDKITMKLHACDMKNNLQLFNLRAFSVTLDMIVCSSRIISFPIYWKMSDELITLSASFILFLAFKSDRFKTWTVKLIL